MIIKGNPITCVLTNDGCFQVNSHNPDDRGYLKIYYRYIDQDGRPKKKRTRGHRFIYEKFNGPIPPGLVVRHTCDNKMCINPLHLILGTFADNIRDCVERGLHAMGTKNGNAKLTEEQVKSILADRTSKQRQLAEIHKVDRSTISDIKRGSTWKHLQLPRSKRSYKRKEYNIAIMKKHG